ncbi:MAG TPA: GspH/FimT family pseudopilin [Thermohalobaculum sp.]|nr:GspH/FimT family pseudopilin [Thermohalobaculum sp.]
MSPAGSAAPGRHSAALGFTLIELLVVLTIIALLATLATPMIQRSVPGVELKTAAEAVRAELRLARGAAISGNRETWLLVDLETGEYRRDGDSRARAVPPSIELGLVTARSELIDDTQGRIRFFPDGTSTGGAVRLTRGDRRLDVAVDWFDGQVSIDESDAQ